MKNHILIDEIILDQGECAREKRKRGRPRKQPKQQESPPPRQIWCLIEEIIESSGQIQLRPPIKPEDWQLLSEEVMEMGSIQIRPSRPRKVRIIQSDSDSDQLESRPIVSYRPDFYKVSNNPTKPSHELLSYPLHDELYQFLHSSLPDFSPFVLLDEVCPDFGRRNVTDWLQPLFKSEKLELQEWDMPRINRALRATRSKLVALQQAVLTSPHQAQAIGSSPTIAQLCNGKGNDWDPSMLSTDLPPTTKSNVAFDIPNLSETLKNIPASSSVYLGAIGMFTHLHQHAQKILFEPLALNQSLQEKNFVWKQVQNHLLQVSESEWNRRRDYTSILELSLDLSRPPIQPMKPKKSRKDCIPKLSHLAALQVGASWSNLEVSNSLEKPECYTLRDEVRNSTDDELYEMIPETYRGLVLWSHLAHLTMLHSPFVTLLFSLCEDVCKVVGLEEIGWMLLNNALNASVACIGVDMIATKWRKEAWQFIFHLARKVKKSEQVLKWVMDTVLEPFALSACVELETRETVPSVLLVLGDEYSKDVAVEAYSKCLNVDQEWQGKPERLTRWFHKLEREAIYSKLFCTNLVDKFVMQSVGDVETMMGVGLTLYLLKRKIKVDTKCLDNLQGYMCRNPERQTFMMSELAEVLNSIASYADTLSQWPTLRQVFSQWRYSYSSPSPSSSPVIQPIVESLDESDEEMDISDQSDTLESSLQFSDEEAERVMVRQYEEDEEFSPASRQDTPVRRVGRPRRQPFSPSPSPSSSSDDQNDPIAIIIPSSSKQSSLSSLFSISVPTAPRERRPLTTLVSSLGDVVVKSPKSIWK